MSDTMDRTEENKQIVQTIFHQFGGNRALMMIGGKAISYFVNQSLILSFKGYKKANKLVIRYNRGTDDYTMIFSKISRDGESTNAVVYNDIYGDMLQDVFTSHTGLYLSL